MYWTSGVFVKDGAPGRHCLLWTIAVLLISILPCGNSSVTLLETIPHDQEMLNERMDEQIVHIFATINHIDIINSLIGTDERERKLMQKLLRQRTVRWFNTPPAALCAFAQHDLDSECYSEPQRQEQRGEGYIIYDDLSTINGYECLFDPTGTYVVVNDQSRFTERFGRVQVLEALQRIWMKRGTYRVYVWVQDTLYGYDPFQPLDTVSEYGTLVELGAGAMLPTVPPNNLAGYPVRIEVFRSVYSNPVVSDSKPLNIPTYSGPDVTARDVFCRVLNATVVQVPADRELFGDRLPNGSFSGALGRLVRREVDIVFTGFFIKDYATRDIDFTAGLYSDAVCCLVKKASRIPEALLPLYIFPGDIWALLCMIGLCCSSVWCLLRWCVRQMQQPVASLWSRHHRLAVLFNLSRTVRMGGPGRQALQLYIDTFILLVSAPYQRFTRSGVERLFLTGLLLVSLIFVSLYQSGLAAVFVNPVYYPDIGTLQQLDESRMVIPVKYRGFLDDVFAVNYSRLMDSLRARMQHLPLKESMLARVARLGTIATVTRKTTLALDNAIYMTTRQLHMIPECPRTYNLAYVMPHRSVFGEQFNKVLLRMVGGGLIDHWIDEARYGWTLKDWRVVQAMMESSFKVLTVLDMQFPFYVLMIGLALSIGTIAAELVHFHRTHRPST
uniref:Ionotropic glutamate receptor L-glutamate and glycine-binding domain-containing protein n=1 Tax=Anopheles culicifacies TaxID=139723 RepID=A0A182MF46_9DIPT